MRRWRVGTILSLALLAGCGVFYVDLGTGTKPPSGMSLKVLVLQESPEGIDLQLELRNDSNEVLTYRGYPPSQPLFVHQYLTNAAWVQPRWLMCGYGQQELVLLPGQHVTWMAKMDTPNRLQRLRVGIESTTADYTVWSPIVDPATRRVGASPRS